jgi:MoaA/NifB/PqqE/SkfB family radical SAM enzyme
MTTFRDMINNTEYNEFMDKFYEEATKEEIEKMTWCKRCPFREECGKADLFYGCGVWEEYMGEDL